MYISIVEEEPNGNVHPVAAKSLFGRDTSYIVKIMHDMKRVSFGHFNEVGCTTDELKKKLFRVLKRHHIYGTWYGLEKGKRGVNQPDRWRLEKDERIFYVQL